MWNEEAMAYVKLLSQLLTWATKEDRKFSLGITGLRAEFRTQDLLDTKQDL
jgi:hypothetical protein